MLEKQDTALSKEKSADAGTVMYKDSNADTMMYKDNQISNNTGTVMFKDKHFDTKLTQEFSYKSDSSAENPGAFMVSKKDQSVVSRLVGGPMVVNENTKSLLRTKLKLTHSIIGMTNPSFIRN